MKKYEVSLEGTNFLFNQDGEHRKFGFQAKVIVLAKDPEEAGKMAALMVRQNPLLKDALVDAGSVRPEISLLQVKKTSPIKLLLKKQSIKIDFHPEDEE